MAQQGSVQNAQANAPSWTGAVQYIFRLYLIFAATQFVMRSFIKPPTEDNATNQPDRPVYLPAVTYGDVLDVKVFLSNQDRITHDVVMKPPSWQYGSYILGSGKDVTDDIPVVISNDLIQSNATLYAHCVLEYKVGKDSTGVPVGKSMALTHSLVVFQTKKSAADRQSLLSANSTEAKEDVPKKESEGRGNDNLLLPHWKRNLTMSIIPYSQPVPLGQAVQPPLDTLLKVDPETETYRPLVYLNDFWILKEDLQHMNETTTELMLSIRFHELELWKAALYTQMEVSFNIQKSMGMMGGHEVDSMKRIFLEANPYYLALTTFVSLLHTVFDMLAFKSDIGFWSKNESMKGLSARSILINCFCQIVVFLYLLDNDTSMLILFNSSLSLGIEFWKVTKATKVEFVMVKGFIPFIKIKDRDTYVKSQTKVFDDEASVYLSYVLFPLVFGYGVYSLVYETHKSWYSWILSSLVGAVYMFGFILMCPQLYINYRMKSVAHLPWKQMTYKFLNTIIDDMFAFVIKMPTLHRLSVFRDDLVFFIYLYQRWIYRVDKTRVNEFGYSEEKPNKEIGQEEEESKKDK